MGFRHIGVVKDEYAVSKDGMKLPGVLDLDTGMHRCRFSIGIRNSHDKSAYSGAWRSPFRGDGDRDSEVMPIRIPS